ncbi:RICIN domain-containing protein [Streptomyces flavotricini]|uniref:RICIN domain-containing protein n=1 Tax=Streptomyces flavotricini TaxID=66888 RepID=A0ABS8EHZ5_9ACTN|nr:RICIN domain-containing protein [Streptomyces flavotricini]MCC0100652.1 RICIN domain-containing protein [Streptomyces flavotricini]
MTRTLSRIAAVSAGLLLAAGTVLITAPSASAITSGQQHNVASGKCLGIYGNVSDNGQDAIQWDCNGNADQNWDYTGVGSGYYQLKNGNGKCLGIWASTGVAIQWGCNGNADQKWYIDSSGGSAQLRNGADWNKCLTISGGGNGALAVLASCNHQSNQLWY